MCEKYGRWKRGKVAAGWAMKEKLIWALQCFSVFSGALSSLETLGGGWSVWGWSAGSTGHCVGRGSASASPDCPWFVPFPAHSYVIICDKLLCSQTTNPRQCPGLPKQLWESHMHTGPWRCRHTYTLIETHKCAFLYTYSHIDSHKQNFWLQCQVGFVFWSRGGRV